ncbi:hypothetical protein [Streptomyces sp. NPDC017958]|uniref:hypothetical protein n=1 Tax=Streptomyces sp. NPDC017958 TaxID=3365021 RepID=UPI0037A24DBE
MPAGSSSKRERQYEHIKKGAQDRGESAGRAKEIAARTVDQEAAAERPRSLTLRLMEPEVDRIARPWGDRTPYGRGGVWPVRIDSYLEPGVTADAVERWVLTASLLHSNGDAMGRGRP